MTEDTIHMFDLSKSLVSKVHIDEVISKLYYLEVRPATDSELKASKSKLTSQDIRRIISSSDKFIPLYDVYTFNLYLIQRRNVYNRVINNHYRFPDNSIISNIQLKLDALKTKSKSKTKSKPDNLTKKKIYNAELMLKFLSYFDLDILYSTYLKAFYRYAPNISEKTYTCIRRSFMPHKAHLLPYYTKDEVIRLGMNNMVSFKESILTIPPNTTYEDFKAGLTDKDFDDLCKIIQLNDISSKILLKHQNHIIDSGSVGLIQYYTLQGSFFINQYLRQSTSYSFRNDYLENIISDMWKLVLDSPAFDRDYILYRFISEDSYLSNLKIGDIFQDKGFTSTTRDPFYRTDLYKFGFILIKIRIPKNIKGVGLCLETLSHFPNEEEVILPPLTKLKLVSRDEDCEYYHPDQSFASQVLKRYEFECVATSNISFAPRPEYTKTKTIDFLTLDKSESLSIKERISILMNTYFDPMNRVKCKIGDQTFYMIGEYYNSTTAYKNMYALTTTEGFCLYSIFKGYILFMIEIGEQDNTKHIRVNYFTKYSELDRDIILGDANFIEFVSSVAYYFDVPNVVIYADYMSCDRLNSLDSGIKSDKIELEALDTTRRISKSTNLKLKQRTFTQDLLDTNTNEDLDPEDEHGGGSFCVDFYKYLKHNTKRYSNSNTLNIELRPKFDYRDLDVLKDTDPQLILNKKDRDEIYQIYKRAYLPFDKKSSLAGFYIWMIQNKCYLMDIFVAKLDRLYKERNPFNKGYYILDPTTYLYNRSKIRSYNRLISIDYDEDHKLLTLPKNEYRLE